MSLREPEPLPDRTDSLFCAIQPEINLEEGTFVLLKSLSLWHFVTVTLVD